MNKKALIFIAVVVVGFYLLLGKNKKKVEVVETALPDNVEKGDVDFSKPDIHIYNIKWDLGRFDFVATFGNTCIQKSFNFQDPNCRFMSFQDSYGYVFTCKVQMSRQNNATVLLSIKNNTTDFSINKCVNLITQDIS